MGSGTHRFRADREGSAHRRAGSLRARKWIKDKSGDCATTEEAGATRATDAVGDSGRKSTLRCRPVSPPRSETERWATRGMERRLSGAGVLASSCHVAHKKKKPVAIPTGIQPRGVFRATLTALRAVTPLPATPRRAERLAVDTIPAQEDAILCLFRARK